MTIDSVKDKYDSLKDLYEKLFAVIAALGALFAFLGFKGADSFIQAKQRAEETLKKAEDAQAQINKFLAEIYPKNNKAEVNVTTGIVLRHIADAYKLIVEKNNPAHDFMNDKDYIGFLNGALYYLCSVDNIVGVDDVLGNRAAATKGNVYKRLCEYEKAILTLEQRVKNGIGDDDSILYNLACYYTLKAEKEAVASHATKAAECEQIALRYLSSAIELDCGNKKLASDDDDFDYFRSRKDQRFISLAEIMDPADCPMKSDDKCPMAAKA